MNIKLNKEKGITLIALVVTIVVLLILAGVSISMLTGENGIITQAQNSKEETRGGAVEEARDLWRVDKETDKLTNSDTAQTLDELLDDLVEENLLSEEEKEEIKETGQVTIGSRTIEFDLTQKLDVYASVRVNENNHYETIIVYEIKVPLRLVWGQDIEEEILDEIVQIKEIVNNFQPEEIVKLPIEEKEQMLNDMFILGTRILGFNETIEELINIYGKTKYGLAEECRTWKELYETFTRENPTEEIPYEEFVFEEIWYWFNNLEDFLYDYNLNDENVYNQELSFQYTIVTPDGNKIVKDIKVNPWKQYYGPWFAIEIPVENYGEYKMTIKSLDAEYKGTANIEYKDSKYLVTWDEGWDIELYDTQLNNIVDIDEVYIYYNGEKKDIKDRINSDKGIKLYGLQGTNTPYEIEFIKNGEKIKIPVLIIGIPG